MSANKPLPQHISKQDINLLYDAASNGEVARVEAWIKKFGADNLDIQEFYSWTALMYAAREGRTDVVKVLLSSGADPNIKNDLGHDAVFYALKMNYTQTAEVINTWSEVHEKEMARQKEEKLKTVIEEDIRQLKARSRRFHL